MSLHVVVVSLFTGVGDKDDGVVSSLVVVVNLFTGV